MKESERLSVTQMLSRYRGALMGLAALWVVLLHCWIPIVSNHAILGAIEGLVKWNGMLGVEMFFFYSGLGLTYAIRRHSLGRYYANRAKRILFPFWIMAVLYAVTEGWSLERLLRTASGITFVSGDVYAFLWFVPAIFLLYLLFPAYHRLMMRVGDKVAFTLCVLCIWLGAAVLAKDMLSEDIWCMINRFPSFLIGVCIGEMGREKEIRFDWVHWLLCILTLALGWILRSAANQGLIQMIKMSYFAAMTLISVPICLLLSGLFAALEAYGGLIRRLTDLALRALSFVGAFSLELYCVHQWLYGMIYSALEGHVTYLTINIVSIPLLILAGWVLAQVHRLFWRMIGMAGRRIKGANRVR